MPTLAAALREGRAADLARRHRRWRPRSPRSAPAASPSCRCPAGSGRMAGACLIGWDTPHDFGPDERALLTASAGLAGQALMRAHAFDAEHELVGMLQRTAAPAQPAAPAGRGSRRPLSAHHRGSGGRRRLVRRDPAARQPCRPRHRRRPGAQRPAPPPSWARCAPRYARTPSRATRRTWSSRTPTGCSWTWRPTSSPPAATSTSTWRRARPGAYAPGTCRPSCAIRTAPPRSSSPRADHRSASSPRPTSR